MSIWPLPPDVPATPFRIAPPRRTSPTLLLLAAVFGVAILVAGLALGVYVAGGRP